MKFRGAMILGVFLGTTLLVPPLAAQAPPNCPRAGGQVTLGFQVFDFMNDRNYLQQYRSFPASAFRGNLTDVDFYSCPDAERDLKIEFQRRNPFRLVETNVLSLSSEDFAFRVELWRYRNRPLEVFPAATGVGTSFSSVFNSDVPPRTFFRTDRTRFDVEGHIKGAAFGGNSHVQSIWARYANEQRHGRDQFRFVLGGGDRVSGNDTVRWRQEPLEISSDVDEVEAGVLLGRAHQYALAFTFLVDRYTNEAPLTTNATIAPFGGVTPTGATRIRTDGTLGLRTIDFLPDSRALRPTVQFLKGWSEDKYQLFAAYTFGRIDQKQLTPLEEAFTGGYRGRLQTQVVAVSPIIRISETLDLRMLFRDEIRDNESSFGPGQFLNPAANLTAPRLNRLSRLRYGVELNYRPKTTKAAATVELSQRHTDRDLTFGVSPSEFIGPKVTLLRRDTDLTTVRIRGKMEPIRNLAFRAEYRFQGAQNTGLPTEPDTAHYFDLDANYDFARASLNGGLSFHFQENRESNDTHFFTGLIGTTEQATVRQDFVNNSRYYDVTLWLSPGETPLTFTASFNRIEDRSTQNFIHSSRRRFETAAGVLFTLPERTPYENTTNTSAVGVNYQINPKWGVQANYVINQSSGEFSGAGSLVSVLQPFSQFANRIQTGLAGVNYAAPHQFTLSFEYSHDNYDDRVQPASSGNLNTFHFSIRKAF
jgi:predicted porin